MKLFIYIVMMLFAKVSLAQDEVELKNTTLPEYQGNKSELVRYITNKLVSSIYEKSIKIEGFVILKFKINIDGNASNTEIIKSSGNINLDNEFIKIMEMMPQWKAGTVDGKPVSNTVELPISFNIVKTGSVTTSKIILNEVEPQKVTDSFSIPTFKGGSEDMIKFINKNTNYPKSLKDKGVIGETIVRFIVDSMGKISTTSIRQSSGNVDLDQEAIKVIASMPTWIPAFKNGKRVNQYCDFSVPFGSKSDLYNLRNSKIELSKEHYFEATKNFQNQDLFLAKENYKKAYTLNFYHSDALYNLGVTYFKLNQKDSACYYWNELKVNFARKEADELIKKYCSN